MPSVSSKQHRAMEAAAHGKSTLGIQKKVGKEFVAADKKKTKDSSQKGKTMQRLGDKPGNQVHTVLS